MSRVVQPKGSRGSLKWIQHYVNCGTPVLDAAILCALPGAKEIIWKSPLASDEYAEYRDADFLSLIGLTKLASQLEIFWPKRGPQWDALALSDRADVLLVEAKAHLAELRSPPSQAGETSLKRIQAALGETAVMCGAPSDARWHGEYYQLANRLAHLHLLRRNGVPAWLVLVNFLGDSDMGGPDAVSDWEAAYSIAYAALGLDPKAPLLAHVLHIYLDVRGV